MLCFVLPFFWWEKNTKYKIQNTNKELSSLCLGREKGHLAMA